MELNLITQNTDKQPRRIECKLRKNGVELDLNIYEMKENKLLESITIPYKSLKSFIRQCDDLIIAFDSEDSAEND